MKVFNYTDKEIFDVGMFLNENINQIFKEYFFLSRKEQDNDSLRSFVLSYSDYTISLIHKILNSEHTVTLFILLKHMISQNTVHDYSIQPLISQYLTN